MPGYGGKRPGSGRKPGARNLMQRIATDVARQVLNEVDAVKLWKKFLYCNSPKVAAGCLQYLTDRAFGRPTQLIGGSGQPVKIELQWSGSPDWLRPNVTVNQAVFPPGEVRGEPPTRLDNQSSPGGDDMIRALVDDTVAEG